MWGYDDWVVPGEVKYAERKAVEIEAQLKRYNKDYENSSVYLISGTGFQNRIFVQRIYS